MATVTTALALVRDYVPYERPPQPQTLWTAIPRGLQSGIVNNGTLDAKPVNDDQLLTCTMTLPPNFGYVMADAQLTLTQDRANDWTSFVNLRLTNFYRGATGNVSQMRSDYRQEFTANSLFNASKSMVVAQPWPTFPMIAFTGSSPIIVVLSTFNGNDTVAAAGDVFAFVSFWQFDLEQIRKYPINSPQPVHSR